MEDLGQILKRGADTMLLNLHSASGYGALGYWQRVWREKGENNDGCRRHYLCPVLDTALE